MDHSEEYSRGGVTRVAETESEFGMLVYVAVNILTEQSRTPTKPVNYVRGLEKKFAASI